jgi:hypothetical protein
MISTPIKISVQEVIDFPVHTLKCNNKWNDIIDPKNDESFKRKRPTKKHKNT